LSTFKKQPVQNPENFERILLSNMFVFFKTINLIKTKKKKLLFFKNFMITNLWNGMKKKTRKLPIKSRKIYKIMRRLPNVNFLKPKSIFTIAQSHKKCITLPARNFFVA
jgi:hypothetical protein